MKTLWFGLLAVCAVQAQEKPLVRPVPFAPDVASGAARSGLRRISAERAQALGLPAVAAAIDRQLLAEPGADVRLLTLDLATALIDAGDPAGAQAALGSAPGPHGSRWHLRAALAAADLRRFDVVRAEFRDIKPAELGGNDRAWWIYLQGVLAASTGDAAGARLDFQRAVDAAGNSLAQATFLIAAWEQEILLGKISDESARHDAQLAAQFRGREQGYHAARTLALYLAAVGRKAEAVAALEAQLQIMPAADRARADDFRLLVGLIAGADSPAGRAALMDLLESGPDPSGPNNQLMALQLLAQGSAAGAARAEFRDELDRLIATGRDPAIMDHLLLYRADIAIGDRDYAEAETAANELLQRYPGSSLRSYGLGILTTSAWDQARFRAAASFAVETRGSLPPGENRSLLNVVAAEAWFRAREYSAAAQTYAAVLRDPPGHLPEGGVGDLMFLLIQADIDAHNLDAARSVLDRSIGNPAFTAVDRWRSEYNLALAFEAAGRSAEAYRRVAALVASPTVAPDPALRSRLAWLEADLAFEARDFPTVLRLTAALPEHLNGVPGDLRTEIAASAELLRARALLAMGRSADAEATLQRLGADYPNTAAAVQAFIDEAEDYAAHDRTVEAERTLLEVAQKFPRNADFAAYALLRAASLAQSLGQQRDYDQAIRWIEQLVTTYPDSTLIVPARLREGDLLRLSDQFPQAEQTYLDLINRHGDDPDAIYARLGLADCYSEETSGDPSRAERAISLYDDLLERVDAPEDLRVEAGYKLGELYRRRGQVSDAIVTWFGEVVQPFLLDPRGGAALGSDGRMWMSRTLLDLGRVLDSEGRADEARQAWDLLVRAHLVGSDLARSLIGSLAPAGKS